MSPTQTDAQSLRTYLLAVAEHALDADLRPKASASDLVQHTFLLAHQAAPNYLGSTREEQRCWLKRILLNTLCNLRRRFARKRRSLRREQPLLGDAVADTGSTPSREASRAEENQRIRNAVERLPGNYRHVVLWHVEEGCGFAEIGRRLGCSEDAARMAWHRALKRLRRTLDEMPSQGGLSSPS